MPQLSGEHLLFCLLASLGAPFLARRGWAVWRTLFGAAYLAWFDLRALVTLALASGLVHTLGSAAERSPRVARPIGIIVLILIFVGVRVNAPAEGGGLVAPIGFAFALLRLVHYWVERCGGFLPQHTLWDLFGWMSYLPTVLVGPVQRFDDWLQWEKRHRFDGGDAALGLRRILYGYAKLVVGAYAVAGSWLPDRLVQLPTSVGLSITNLLVLYLSFAGLSDIAIGLGRVWGQRVPENFDRPLMAYSLPRFWQSWHMTVSALCRTYVYLPMLAATRRPILAAAAAIAAFALWHEPKIPWLAWGAWHGLGLVLWRRLLPVDAESPWPLRALSTVLTWAWVLAGFWGLTVWPQGDAWWMR